MVQQVSVRLYVRPSVTRVILSKRLNISSKFFHCLIGPWVWFYSFCHQGLLRKSYGITPNGGTEYNGGYNNFQPICGYILETVIDRGIFTEKDEYKFVCALSNSVAFDDLELPWTLVSRSQYSLKVNISQTVHSIHSVFGSSPWVFGIGGSNGSISCSIKSKMASDGP